MRRSERRNDLVIWGALGLGVGLLAGFALAEVSGSAARKDPAPAEPQLLADRSA